MKLKSQRILKFTALFAAVILCLFMLAGCSASADWVRRTIEANYYCFNEEDYASLKNMRGLTVKEMMSRLDRYSAYYTAEQYAAVLADNGGSKSGIGISYTYESGRGVVLQSVVGNSPAMRAGLKAGDVIVSAAAGGKTVQFSSMDGFSSFVTARATNENFTVTLSDGTSVSLAKKEYTASYVSMYTSEASYDIQYSGKTRQIIRDPEGGISVLPEGTAYFYLSQFYGDAVNEMGVLITEFNSLGCDTLILDLRGDGGGYVDVMARIGCRFTVRVADNAVAMRAIYKGGNQTVDHCYLKTSDLRSGDSVVPAGTKVYAMANHNTASASEALLGVLVSYNILDCENIFLSDYRQVAGYENSQPKSYGKGIMQSTFVNISGEALKLTVAGIYWQNGVTIHNRGLTKEEFGCSVAPATDTIVNVGMDDELLSVTAKINADRAAEQ